MAKFHKLTVADRKQETDDAVSIGFAVPEALKDAYMFDPGQYLTLRADLDGEDVRRSYSICSVPDEDGLRVAVKKVAGGVFSNFAADLLEPGMEIDVMTPEGRFILPRRDGEAPASEPGMRHYAVFAAGSGITPVMSIIASELARDPQCRFTLFYGNKTVGSIIFRDALEDLKDRFHARFTLVHVLSREAQEAPLFNGRLDAEKAAQLVRTLAPVERVDSYLICGPGSMISDISSMLQDQGVPSDRILFEMFTPIGEGADGASIPRGLTAGATSAVAEGSARDADAAAVVDGLSEVTVIIDGVRTSFKLDPDGESLIDAARRAGADAPYSCKGGVCATCRAKIVEGAVEMDNNYALRDEEVAAGDILTCQSHPRSATLVVDYDAI